MKAKQSKAIPSLKRDTTHYFKIDHLSTQVKARSGAYIIRLCKPESERLQHIQRLHGINKSGILYIGGSGNGKTKKKRWR